MRIGPRVCVCWLLVWLVDADRCSLCVWCAVWCVCVMVWGDVGGAVPADLRIRSLRDHTLRHHRLGTADRASRLEHQLQVSVLRPVVACPGVCTQRLDL